MVISFKGISMVIFFDRNIYGYIFTRILMVIFFTGI